MLENLLLWAVPRAPFFGIVGAAIILASWMVTNTISKRLASAKGTLDRLAAEDSLRQRLVSIQRRYREMKATLTRVDLMLSEMNPRSLFSTFPQTTQENSRNIYALLQTAETSFFEHEDLQEILLASEKLSRIKGLPVAIARKLKIANEEARHLLQEYDNIVKTWDEQRRRSIDLIRQGNTDSAIFEEATTDFISAAFPLHERFSTMRQHLLILYGRALGHFEKRYQHLNNLHTISEWASWLFYVLGTSVAILGKWLEIQAKQS